MNNKRYSLCLNLKNPKNEICQFYRIADLNIDKSEFYIAEYSSRYDEYSNKYNPFIIGGVATWTGKAECREWDSYENDITKSYSKECIYSPIEIIFLNNLFLGSLKENESKIRDFLYKGISIPHEITNNFLLVVGKNNSQYITLECNINNFLQKEHIFSINKECNDMAHTTHYFNVHIINENDILNIDHFIERYDIPNRFFYKYLQLNKSNERFYLRDLSEYAIVYIKKRLKEKKDIFQLTMSEIKKFINTFKDLCIENEEMNDFLSSSFISPEDLSFTIKKLTASFKDDFLQDNDMDILIKEWLLSQENIFEKCTEAAKKIWLKEKDSERYTIEKEIDEHTLLLNKIKEEIVINNDKLKRCKTHSSKLEDSIKKLTLEHNELKSKKK
ncbi:Hypothetical protein CM240_2936 [Clostridium bornimense]|uniref:Uncharacterized protein n=1 Tax=Clostridium bornimense TaxID=1216932 RepID=W6S008_9CLOT|nr:hypothetical protein [Clostridium bornimense]CDM70053.1 Hypothetical protein CM240_2936 [Clostridium bornimense]